MSFSAEATSPSVLRCAHKVGRKHGSGEGVRDIAPVRTILEDILDQSRLLARRFPVVYAYKIDLVPSMCRDWVLVVFEVEIVIESLERIHVTGSAMVLRSDFGLSIPSVPRIASVSDEIGLVIDFVALSG